MKINSNRETLIKGIQTIQAGVSSKTGTIPIVIMTGKMMDRSTSDLIKRETNVREYLEKPIKTELLAALLHKLLNTRPVRKPTPRF